MVSDDSDSIAYGEEDEKSTVYRASTAPPRPLTELEEFRRSEEFFLMEQAVMSSGQIIQKSNGKVDLDSPEGQKACKKYLKLMERMNLVQYFSHPLLRFLLQIFKTRTAARGYRHQFSKAYRILYKEGSLCYLTEILDSAQEG